MATLGRHSDGKPGALLTWIPRVIIAYVVLVLIIGGLTLGWVLTGSSSNNSTWKGQAAIPIPSRPPPSGSVPAGSVPTSSSPAGSVPTGSVPSSGELNGSADDDLVANALKIKPLENIERGDRVIFRGKVCAWQMWNRTINTSTIKCPGRNVFQTQTGRLTPVELKRGTRSPEP